MRDDQINIVHLQYVLEGGIQPKKDFFDSWSYWQIHALLSITISGYPLVILLTFSHLLTCESRIFPNQLFSSRWIRSPQSLTLKVFQKTFYFWIVQSLHGKPTETVPWDRKSYKNPPITVLCPASRTNQYCKVVKYHGSKIAELPFYGQCPTVVYKIRATLSVLIVQWCKK